MNLEDLLLLEKRIEELDYKINKIFSPQLNLNLFTSFYSPPILQAKNVINNNSLQFFFFSEKFSLDIIDSYENIDFIKKNIINIELLTKQDLLLLKNELYNLQNFYYYNRNREVLFSDSKFLDLDIKRCNELLKKFSQTNYNNYIIKISSNEEINGYKLYDIDNNLMAENTFIYFKKIWDENKLLDKNQFRDKFEEIACTEWSKMNEHGESFMGYWKYPKNTYEYKNAYHLTFDDNFNKLYNLPYPKEFLLETVKIGCNNRLESVRYSNFLGEWFKRKLEKFKYI